MNSASTNGRYESLITSVGIKAAEKGFLKLLKRAPGQPDALHLAGLIALKSGRLKEARRRLDAARQAAPGNPVYHGSLGALARETGDLYQRAL